MQLQLLFLTAGCLCAVQSVEPLNVHDESCSMQAHHALGESSKRPDSSVNSTLLDRLVLKSKHQAEVLPEPENRPRPIYVQTITNGSAPVKNQTNAGHGGIVQRVHSFLDARPEVKALLKALLISWILAGLLGLCAVAAGKAKIYPPYKYLSWREIKEEEAYIVGSSTRFWYNLEPGTRWSLFMVLLFFLVIFGILWKMEVIQPVMNQLACYIYVLLFFGIILSVIITDVLGKVKRQAQQSLEPVLRFLEKIEGHPLLPEATNPRDQPLPDSTG